MVWAGKVDLALVRPTNCVPQPATDQATRKSRVDAATNRIAKDREVTCLSAEPIRTQISKHDANPRLEKLGRPAPPPASRLHVHLSVTPTRSQRRGRACVIFRQADELALLLDLAKRKLFRCGRVFRLTLVHVASAEAVEQELPGLSGAGERRREYLHEANATCARRIAEAHAHTACVRACRDVSS